MALLADVWQLLLAAGFGAFFWQYVLLGSDRRKARASAREALSAVESASYTRSLDATTGDGFRDKRRAFVTAAMVARLPRELAEAYSTAVAAAAAASREHLEHEGTSMIHWEVAEHLERYFKLVSFYLWHPVRGRLGYRRGLKRLAAEEQELLLSGPPDARFLKYEYQKA